MNSCKLITMFLKYTFLFFLFLSHILCKAQEAKYFDKNGDDHVISRYTSPDIINKYLDENGFKNIEFNPIERSRYPFRVKTKKGDWMLCDNLHIEFIKADKYSIHFPSEVYERVKILTAQKGKKTYFFSLDWNSPVEDVWFDEIKTIKVTDTVFITESEEYQAIEKYIFAIKQKEKWAIVYIDPAKDEIDPIFRLTPFCFDSYEGLPIERAKQYLLEIDQSKYTGMPFIFYRLEELYNYKEIVDIEFDSNDIHSRPRLKDKKGDWYLFDTDEIDLIGQKGYSLEFDSFNCGNFTIAEKKGSKYFFSMGNEGYYIFENIVFDEIKEHYSWGKFDLYDPNTGEIMIDDDGQIQMDSTQFCDYLMLKKDDKWALAFYDQGMQKPYQLTGFHFEDYKSLPDSILESFIWSTDGLYNVEYNSEAFKGASQILLEIEDIDIIQFISSISLASYGDQFLYKIRNSDTKRWSYVIKGELPSSTELPTAASSITNYEYRNSIGVIEVWCDDEVGYYFYDGENIKQILDCKYDDFQYVFLDSTYGCALKKDGMWELYEMDAPNKMVEGSAKSIDELIELWLNR